MESSTIISHYEIEGELGRGGMGIVYKARDVRLDRPVALKVLPETLSHDGEAKSRFLHEGRAASTLDHANICTIYEIGETEDGQLFIAMPYVDGRPLSDIIAEGPFKLSRALELAIAMGEGLAHSHRRGVVHRDMKPSNVMVTEAGDVKILDFGLAKLLGATQLTVSGTTLGTAAYMSPEQAQGRPADHRTDVWALGVILYEMVSGVKPFQGEYQQALTYSIVNAEPEPLTGLRTGIPVDLDRIVFKALEKNPDDRYQHVEDLLVDLRQVLRSIASPKDASGSGRIQPTATGRRPLIPWLVAMLAVAAAIYAAAGSSDREAVRLSATIETDPLPIGPHPLAPPFAIAPDGSRIVYSRRMGSSSILVLRKLDSFIETPLVGTEGGHTPFFSPDGEWVGFLTPARLKKVEMGTGNVVTIAQLSGLTHGGAWAADGTIFVAFVREIASVPSSGGMLETFARVDSAAAGEHYLLWPEVLPGSDRILCTTVDRNGRNAKVWAARRHDGERTFVTEGANASYLSSGHLVFPRDGALWIARFDPKDAVLTSTPSIAFGGVLSDFPQEPSLALYDVVDAGALAYVAQRQNWGRNVISWVSESGEPETVSEEADSYLGVSLSPDGRRIATTVTDDEGARQVRILDLSRNMWFTLTAGFENWWPLWGPDGETVYVNRGEGSDFGIASQRVGSMRSELILRDGNMYQILSWIPHTNTALLQRTGGNDSQDMDIVRMEIGSKPEPLIATGLVEVHPAASPNGKWIAYARTPNPREHFDRTSFQVFVTGTDRPEPAVQVSQNGGWAPLWSRNGDRLYYESEAGLMAVEWPNPDELNPSSSRIFYSGPFGRSVIYGRGYDVGLDDRLLVLLPEAEIRNIRFVTGWLDGIEK